MREGETWMLQVNIILTHALTPTSIVINHHPNPNAYQLAHRMHAVESAIEKSRANPVHPTPYTLHPTSETQNPKPLTKTP